MAAGERHRSFTGDEAMRIEHAVQNWIAVLAWAAATPCHSARAQSAPVAGQSGSAQASLEDQLQAQYRTGTVWVVSKYGIVAVPQGTPAVPLENFENGALHSTFSFLPFIKVRNTKALQAGEKVNLEDIFVDVAHDTIGFHIHECDSCNGATKPSAYQAKVRFKFSRGYLATATASQVEATISQVFAHDAVAAGDVATSPSDSSSQPPSTPPSIELGQTIDQVVAALGQPRATASTRPGTQIYVYKDLKVTFVNGKVSDVQ
jgi:hypothetical protein